jgi:tetratricopeptide (TPR) repeat protein
MSASWIKPTWEHAGSRFMRMTLGVVDVLQTNFLNGISLDNEIPGMNRETAAVIVAESLEADRVWNLPPDKLLDGLNQGPESDFKTAVLAEMLFAAGQEAQQQNRQSSQVDFRAFAMASMEKIALTPTASPMLWYEDIFWELAQSVLKDDPDQTLDWFKRSLVHNLKFNDGNNGIPILRDLSNTYLEMGNLESGLNMLTALLHHEPDDIWTYNLAAITFDHYGLVRLGIQATQRGLQLLDAKGDPEDLRSQLEDSLKVLQSSKGQDREADILPEAKEAFQTALELDFDASKRGPIADICRELIPDLDHTFVKSKLTSAQFPLPNREEIIQYFTQGAVAAPKKKTRRRHRKRRR